MNTGFRFELGDPNTTLKRVFRCLVPLRSNAWCMVVDATMLKCVSRQIWVNPFTTTVATWHQTLLKTNWYVSTYQTVHITPAWAFLFYNSPRRGMSWCLWKLYQRRVNLVLFVTKLQMTPFMDSQWWKGYGKLKKNCLQKNVYFQFYCQNLPCCINP